MTDELTQREVARKSPFVEGNSTRLLEATHRLHAASDEGALGSAISAFFVALLGTPPIAVRITHDVAVARRFGAEHLTESAGGLLERARQDGIPVIDGQPPIGVALPIHAAGRIVGAVYVAHPEVKHRLGGSDLDLLRAAAAHVGCASVALRTREAPGDPKTAAGIVASAQSLHDAKLAFEHRLLELRLHDARGNVAAAARALGMDRGQLSRLMRKHNLERASFRAERTPPNAPKTA